MAAIAIILLLLLAPFLVAADVFCDNVKAIASILSKNASSSPVHFATTTYGQSPDIVYALALCRGDGSACGECIANWFDKGLNLTQCDRVSSNYRTCTIVYGADGNILAAPSNTTGGYGDNTPPFQDWNIKNVSRDIPLIVGLTRELLVATVEKAASMVPRRYATGVMDMERVTTYPKVYSQVQCTPDLSTDECSACLHRLLGMVNSTMALRMGGQMGVTRCYFRYEAYQFYDAEPLLSLPSPPATAPAPTLTKHMSKLE
jgi:hypothetical protein